MATLSARRHRAGPQIRLVLGAAVVLASACGRNDVVMPSAGSSGDSSTGRDSSTGPLPTTTTDPFPTTTTDPLPTTTTDVDTDTTTDADTDTSTGPVPAECGNGLPEAGEQCDDGNADPTDACSNACTASICGDGIVWEGVEACDDANTNDDDACHDDCTATSVVQIALGGNHSCARLDNGAIRCWGNGNNGRTGLGSLDNVGDDEPASAAAAADVGSPAVQLVAALSHTCVREATGLVNCFGRAAEGQLGHGDLEDVGDDESPASVGPVPLPGPVAALGMRGGSFHACALMVGGDVRCWGLAADGRLGIPGLTGSLGDDEPVGSVAPVSVGGDVVQITTGLLHTCARLSDGQLRCWGSNASGQLGSGNSETVGDDEFPSQVEPVAVGGTVTHVSAGFHHTCALLDTGQVRCWGRGNNGRLGYGNTAWVGLLDTPADVGTVDVGGTVVQLEAGNGHTCALLLGGNVRCWGWAGQGQLGYGNLDDIGDNETPASAGDVPLGHLAVQIAADGNHTCALLDTGAVRCWGNGGDGRLGYGNLDTIGDDETPADAGDVPLLP